jgi:hypothetical protein
MSAAPEGVAILLLERGEPVEILGYAAKKRRGALVKTLERHVHEIVTRWPELGKENPKVEYTRHALVFGPLAVAFEGYGPAPPAEERLPPNTATERARAHRRRRRYGLEEVTVECPADRAEELRRIAAEMVAARRAEVDRG